MSSSSSSVADKLGLLDKEDSTTNNSKKPPIGMAFMLRESNPKYFEPRISAIGPVHHNKEERYKHAEEFKMVFARKFIKQCEPSSSETLFNAIKEKIEVFKNCYMEDVRKKYTDEEQNNELALMLLIDGCAVLQFILSIVDKTLNELLKNDLAAFSAHDIFLLENQLPFDLLELLMNNHKDKEKILRSIEDFIDTNMVIKPKDKMDLITSRPVHLLDLLRTRMIQCPQPTSEHVSITIIQGHPTKKGAGTPSNKNGSSSAGAPSTNWQTFRNISELKRAGINVKPSETSCLKDFNFEEGNFWYDTVKLPSIRVDDSTAPKFLNIIAYEMLPEFKNEGEVSSYICLMDSLIDNADDVKQLRNAKVLHNMLGSDDEVAKLFNVILGKDLVPNPEAYAEFKRKIQGHYDNECKTTFAQGFHDHFSTPWTRLAFAGAIIGLILSFLQTLSGFLK